MTRLLPAFRSRRSERHHHAGSTDRPAGTQPTLPVVIPARSAAEHAPSGGGADTTTPGSLPDGSVQRAVDVARQRLEVMWSDDRPIAAIEQELRATGISDRVMSLLIAERRAIDRIRAAGLDPSVVRSDVDDLIRLYH